MLTRVETTLIQREGEFRSLFFPSGYEVKSLRHSRELKGARESAFKERAIFTPNFRHSQ
jgi:hypothetical protein